MPTSSPPLMASCADARTRSPEAFRVLHQGNPNDGVPIDLPKGSYVPGLELREEPQFAVAAPRSAAIGGSAACHGCSGDVNSLDLNTLLKLRDIAVGMVLATAILFNIDLVLQSRRAPPPAIAPLIARAWGPMARADANPLIVLERPQAISCGSLPFGARVGGVLACWATARDPGIVQEAGGASPTGLRTADVASIFVSGREARQGCRARMLHLAGSSVKILPDRAAPISNLRGRMPCCSGIQTLFPPLHGFSRVAFIPLSLITPPRTLSPSSGNPAG